MPEQKKLRLGIVGFGSFAERVIAPAVRMSGIAELTAIQKRSLKAAKAKAEECGIPHAFDTVESLVAHPDVDAVFLASANSCHRPETLAAARAAKHVLVEKPMALNVREAREMVSACKRGRVKLMVGHMVRLSPLVRRLRELVRSGMLGEIVAARADYVYDGRLSTRAWLLDRNVAGGGPLFDVGVHCLDTLRFILDDEVKTLRSQLNPRPTKKRTEETAHLLMRFRRGVIGTIACSYNVPFLRCEIEVVGSEGMASITNFNFSSVRLPLTISMGDGNGKKESRTEEIEVPNLYVEEIKQFVDCIRSHREPDLSGKNGLENQRVLDAAMSGRGL